MRAKDFLIIYVEYVNTFRQAMLQASQLAIDSRYLIVVKIFSLKRFEKSILSFRLQRYTISILSGRKVVSSISGEYELMIHVERVLNSVQIRIIQFQN